MIDVTLGIIGGSGLYDIDESGTPDWRAVESPWGRPSDAVLHAQVAGAPLASSCSTIRFVRAAMEARTVLRN